MIELKSLGLKEAEMAVKAMLRYVTVTKPGKPMAFAVVDSAGVLIYFLKMDGCDIIARRMAENKAYTAIVWQRDTRELQDTLKKGRDIVWYGEAERQAPVPGGIPVRLADGSIVGAVSSSGRGADEDEEVSLIGVKALKL